MPCSLIERHPFKEPASSIFCPEDWGSRVLRNTGNDQAGKYKSAFGSMDTKVYSF